MKNFVYILYLTILFLSTGAINTSHAQSPAWSWATKASNLGGSLEVSGMGSDAAGNTYSIGFSYSGMQFGNLPSQPGGMFLVKHSPQGNPVWARQANCRPHAIATDSVGNSYVAGTFWDTLMLGSNLLICKGRQDSFVARFDSAGNVMWVKQAGGPGYSPGMPGPIFDEDQVTSLGIDEMGNCYIAGLFIASDTSAAMFDTIAVFPPNPVLYPIKFNIIAKYNVSGHVQWVKSINSMSLAFTSIAAGKHGQCFAVGGFRNQVDFGITTLTSHGQEDICLISFDTNGNLSWAKNFGGSGNDRGDGVAVDKQGDVIIAGSFVDTVHFGSFTLVKPVPPTSSVGTMFIAKLDNSGNVLWASQVRGSGWAGDSELTLDAAGNSYISSVFKGNIQVGQQTFSTNHGFSDLDVLVSKWSPTGAPVWAIAAQGIGLDIPKDLAIDPVTGACYVSGNFEYNLNFGSALTLQTGQTSTFFLAKLGTTVTGVPEVAKNGAWHVYPNPAAQAFYVAHSGAAAAEASGKFLLYNTTGQLVRTIAFSNATQFAVKREGLPAGLYFYKLQVKGKITGSGKVVLH